MYFCEKLRYRYLTGSGYISDASLLPGKTGPIVRFSYRLFPGMLPQNKISHFFGLLLEIIHLGVVH